MGVSQLAADFLDLVKKIDSNVDVPNIDRVFFPKLDPNKPVQGKKEKFLVVQLGGGGVGICHTLIPPEFAEKYNKIREHSIIRTNPIELALEYGSDDPVDNVLALACINAISQHVMKITNFLDANNFTSDPTGNLEIQREDVVGMVGLFIPLVRTIDRIGSELIVLEKREELIKIFPKLNITLDPNGIHKCNKILCTSTTLLNNSLEEILLNCNKDSKISIIGPTAGYLPDPLFKLGVDVIGGTTIMDDDAFFDNISNHKRWSTSVRKYCLERERYPGIDTIIAQLK